MTCNECKKPIVENAHQVQHYEAAILNNDEAVCIECVEQLLEFAAEFEPRRTIEEREGVIT